jgi:cysteine desulfurase
MERMPVYLDYNASAPMRPEALEAVVAASALAGNPSSVHRFGRLARRTLEDARERVAAMVGARPERVVFTSGGTEANNLAILGAGRQRFLASATEHDSVLRAAAAELIPVGGDGVVDLAALAAKLAADPRAAVVAVMLANNETGVIQPVAEAARIAHAHGALLLCDAVQAAGRLPITMSELGADCLTLSAHKLGGPKGVGALILGEDLPLAARQLGGGQERGRRAGTENLPGVAGFGAVAALASESVADQTRLATLRDRLEAGVRRLAGDVILAGAGAPRLANTATIVLPGVPAERQVIRLDLAGIAVSAGAACSSGKLRASPVLAAMGFPPALAGCAIRVSLGWQSAAADVDRFLAAWGDLALGREGSDLSVEPAA